MPNGQTQRSNQRPITQIRKILRVALVSQIAIACSYEDIRPLGADPILDQMADVVSVDLPTALDPDGYRFETASRAFTATSSSTADRNLVEMERAFHAFYDPRYGSNAGVRRNRVQQRLIAASDHNCSAYRDGLRRLQSDSNFLLDLASLGLASAAAVVSGGTATNALAASAAFTSGARTATNDAYLRQLTMETVSRAIEVRRLQYWDTILPRRTLDINSYGVEFAVRDAMHYHSLCNLIAGLEQASDAVSMARDPGLRRMLEILGTRGIESTITLNPAEAAASIGDDLTAPREPAPAQVSLMRNLDGARNQAERGVSLASMLLIQQSLCVEPTGIFDAYTIESIDDYLFHNGFTQTELDDNIINRLVADGNCSSEYEAYFESVMSGDLQRSTLEALGLPETASLNDQASRDAIATARRTATNAANQPLPDGRGITRSLIRFLTSQ